MASFRPILKSFFLVDLNSHSPSPFSLYKGKYRTVAFNFGYLYSWLRFFPSLRSSRLFCFVFYHYCFPWSLKIFPRHIVSVFIKVNMLSLQICLGAFFPSSHLTRTFFICIFTYYPWHLRRVNLSSSPFSLYYGKHVVVVNYLTSRTRFVQP